MTCTSCGLLWLAQKVQTGDRRTNSKSLPLVWKLVTALYGGHMITGSAIHHRGLYARTMVLALRMLVATDKPKLAARSHRRTPGHFMTGCHYAV